MIVMRVFEKTDSALVIELGIAETDFLKQILSDYPLVANESRRFSAFADAEEVQENTQLLQSSLREHTQTNRAKLQTWLASPKTWKPFPDRTLLSLKTEDCSWFLQILNDLRIGSWQKLNRPNPEKLHSVEFNQENAYPLLVMEVSGLLQTLILNAL